MSPKNKGKFGRAKVTAVPETDEFISGVDRVMRALKPHAARLAVFLGVAAVIVVAYTTWQWWQQRKLIGASELYARAVALSQVEIAEPDTEPAADGKAPAPPKPEARPGRPPDPRGLPAEFPSADARATAVLSTLDELSSEYESTSVTQQGLLLQGEALHQLRRFGEAADRYRKYIDGGGRPELLLTAREGLAYAIEGQAMAEKDAKARQAGLEQALKAFGEMQPQEDGARRDEALYHQARIQAELGRKDEARKTLERILTDHPNSSLKQDIEMRLPDLGGAPAK